MKANSRVTSLTKDDIDQLEKIDSNFPVNATFWLGIEKAITEKSPPLELHKCTCGLLVLVPKKYVINAKRRFLHDKKAKCWHLIGFKNSMSSQNSKIKLLTEQISSLLKQKREEAYLHSYGLLPIDSPLSFDHALWKLQLALIIQEDKNQKSHRVNALNILFSYFETTKKANPQEYKRLIEAFFSDKQQIEFMEPYENALGKVIEGENILTDEAYKRVTNKFTPAKRISSSKEETEKRYEQLQIDAYQGYFEIQAALNFLYNLINIRKGGKYEEDPFASKRKIVGDKKGKMVQLIVEEATNKKLSTFIKHAYDNKFRNSTSGHNDYIIDIQKKTIKSLSTSRAYSLKYSQEKRLRIKSLLDAILILGNLAHADYYAFPLSITGIYTIFLHYDLKKNKPINQMTIHQYWSNAEFDPEGENIDMCHFRLSKDNKVLLFSPSSVMPVPGAATVIPTKTVLEWLENAYMSKEIKIIRHIITPKIAYFLTSAKAEHNEDYGEFFIVGQTTHIVTKKNPFLKKIIKKLRKEKLTDMYPKRTSSFTTVKKYRG